MMDEHSVSGSVVGKVAAVVDDTTLVLNVGGEQGVTEGMVFAIAAQYQEISDPDTGESLGKWEVEKARVVVSHVQERMCTVRSPLTRDADPTGTLSTMMVRHSFGLYGQHSEDRRSLDVISTGMAGRPRSQPVQVGDVARAVAVVALQDSAAELPQAAADNPTSPDLPSATYEATEGAIPVAPAAGPGQEGEVPQPAGGETGEEQAEGGESAGES